MRQIQVVHELGVTSAVAIYRLMYGTIFCCWFYFCKSIFSLIHIFSMTSHLLSIILKCRLQPMVYQCFLFIILSLSGADTGGWEGGGGLSYGSGDLPPPSPPSFGGPPHFIKRGGGPFAYAQMHRVTWTPTSLESCLCPWTFTQTCLPVLFAQLLIDLNILGRTFCTTAPGEH